jgi:hypothetical protein
LEYNEWDGEGLEGEELGLGRGREGEQREVTLEWMA